MPRVPVLAGVAVAAASLTSPTCTVGNLEPIAGPCTLGGNVDKAGDTTCRAVAQGTATIPCGRGTTSTLNNEGNEPGWLSNDHAHVGDAGQLDLPNPHCVTPA